MKHLALSTLCVAVASVASAQYVYVPNGSDVTNPGPTGLNTFIRDINAPRTGQLGINQSQLGGLTVGHFVTGITWRMFNGNTTGFPPVDINYADYSIWAGVGTDPTVMSTTFANNFVGAPTMVRTGALTMTANSFPAGNLGVPTGWGFEVVFQTPYQYTGGHLTIEIRHTGSDITNPANSFLEAVASTNDYRSVTAVGNTATTGALATFTVSRLSTSPVPEPATFIALGLGLAGLALARRRK